mmetsp:Transcript_13169/g.33411  ORF Transcript_13169/g.33411 Transcript_13169/m.33411 type:complete len:259 (-) Transcript_13169:168-944(-)
MLRERRAIMPLLEIVAQISLDIAMHFRTFAMSTARGASLLVASNAESSRSSGYGSDAIGTSPELVRTFSPARHRARSKTSETAELGSSAVSKLRRMEQVETRIASFLIVRAACSKSNPLSETKLALLGSLWRNAQRTAPSTSGKTSRPRRRFASFESTAKPRYFSVIPFNELCPPTDAKAAFLNASSAGYTVVKNFSAGRTLSVSAESSSMTRFNASGDILIATFLTSSSPSVMSLIDTTPARTSAAEGSSARKALQS